MTKLKHVVKSQQFDRELLEHIFSVADDMKAVVRTGRNTILDGKLMACLFYEPSTRTRFSFESAMHRLGGSVIGTDKAGEFSSAAKGETLEDTIKVVAGYFDVIVLRHKDVGSAEAAAKVSPVPILNAGDGSGQHPTQALLDLYTIRENRSLDGVHVAIVGDLKYGRTARSLAYLLGKYDNVKITFVAPEQLKMKDDIIEHCRQLGVAVNITDDLVSVLPQVDCVYMTRIQKERMSQEEYAENKDKFILTKMLVDTMKEDAIIMHPLPRVDEIHATVDSDPRARYFEQARNGLYIRMALLCELIKGPIARKEVVKVLVR